MTETQSTSVAHQFEDFEQQHEANTLGMWAFLLTEVMFFGGLFAAYTLYRWAYPDVWAVASRSLDITWGTINTFVLLFSSLTVVMAVHAVQTDKRKLLLAMLAVTILLGLVFMGIKAIEYYDKYEHHHIPWSTFHWEHGGLADERQAQMFFVLYFFLTGLHALHMIIGVGVMSGILYLAWRGRFSSRYYEPVEISGLYWHFVDIVWIFLFPLLYLIDRS